MKIGKNFIDIKSFFKKQPEKINDDFGVAFITGYQGSGKTYFAVYNIYNFFKDYKIKTNIQSLEIKGYDIEYFTKLEEITNEIEEHVVYVIDEISKKYTKEAKQDKQLYSWLQQSRKRKRYVFLITQEYLQIPMWLRGIASVVYTTNKIALLPIFKTIKGYPILDDTTKEWTIDPKNVIIYKRNKKISDFYDTFEPVNVL